MAKNFHLKVLLFSLRAFFCYCFSCHCWGGGGDDGGFKNAILLKEGLEEMENWSVLNIWKFFGVEITSKGTEYKTSHCIDTQSECSRLTGLKPPKYTTLISFFLPQSQFTFTKYPPYPHSHPLQSTLLLSFAFTIPLPALSPLDVNFQSCSLSC